MMKKKTARRRTRTVRYTLLLTPDEFDLANRIAAREYRTLPDFFRAQIYKNAEVNELLPLSTERPLEECARLGES